MATIFLHVHMNPLLQALGAFAEAFFQHAIEGHNRYGNSSDRPVTRRALGGKKPHSVFVDNVSGVSVHYY